MGLGLNNAMVHRYGHQRGTSVRALSMDATQYGER
jgi:hypothetical protein